jgi:hypothetical protein
MTLAMIKEYLRDALHGFNVDPADSPYQRGYEAALKDIEEFINEE